MKLRELSAKATKVPNKPRAQQLMDEAELLTYLHDHAEHYADLVEAARTHCIKRGRDDAPELWKALKDLED